MINVSSPMKEHLVSDILVLTNGEYQLIKNLVYEKFGIHLGDNKKALVAGRLNKIVKENGFRTFREYYNYVLNDVTGDGMNTLINRISTNHTYFFREKIHLDYLTKILLPNIVRSAKQKNQRSIRLWSCGCSSGEEAYSLAMIMSDFFADQKDEWDLAVLGTDISAVALEKAKLGIYSSENIQKLPVSFKYKYFTALKNNLWQVKDELKEMVMFKRLNLMNTSFPFKQQFHSIYCRNVMIYFDQQTRDQLVNKLHRFIEPSGKLFIGLSESLGRSNLNFKYSQPGIYSKIGSK